MAIIRRNAAEVQRLRGLLEVKCRNGCGTDLLITSTPGVVSKFTSLGNEPR